MVIQSVHLHGFDYDELFIQRFLPFNVIDGGPCLDRFRAYDRAVLGVVFVITGSYDVQKVVLSDKNLLPYWGAKLYRSFCDIH